MLISPKWLFLAASAAIPVVSQNIPWSDDAAGGVTADEVLDMVSPQTTFPNVPEQCRGVVPGMLGEFQFFGFRLEGTPAADMLNLQSWDEGISKRAIGGVEWVPWQDGPYYLLAINSPAGLVRRVCTFDAKDNRTSVCTGMDFRDEAVTETLYVTEVDSQCRAESFSIITTKAFVVGETAISNMFVDKVQGVRLQYDYPVTPMDMPRFTGEGGGSHGGGSSTPTSGGVSPAETDGACHVAAEMQAGEAIAATPGWHPDGNIVVTLPDPSSCDVAVSPTWTVGGWEHTWIQLAPGAVFHPPTPASNEMIAVKILRGTLLDINVNGILREDGRWETYVVTPPNRAVSMWLSSSVTDIEAGDQGAAFIFFKATREVLSMPVTDMASGPPMMLGGPFIDQLEWVKFGDYYDVFAEIEFYNFAGIYVQEYDHERLGFFQWWTFREDMDADGYHNHANMNPDNTFAELHMALFSCSGSSGMQTTLPNTENLLTQPNPDVITAADGNRYFMNDQTEVQISIPLPPGYCHGPLWSVERDTGYATLDCDGGVVYPYHRMLGGMGHGVDGFHNPPRYTLWIAFEHPPAHTVIPTTMLAYWRNAYLQTEMDGCQPAGHSRD